MTKKNQRTDRRRETITRNAQRDQRRIANTGKALQIGIVAIIALAIIGAGVFIVKQGTGKNTSSAVPANVYSGAITLASDKDGVLKVVEPDDETVGSRLRGEHGDAPLLSKTVEGSPSVVQVYEDFQCPGCAEFSSKHGALVRNMTLEGDIVTSIQPIAFLDSMSGGNGFSTRSVNAVLSAIDSGQGDLFFEISERLFESQPAEGGDGMSDAELISILQEAGVDTTKNLTSVPEITVEEAVASIPFKRYIQDSTGNAFNGENIQSTPEVRVNGKPIDQKLLGDSERLAIAMLTGEVESK